MHRSTLVRRAAIGLAGGLPLLAGVGLAATAAAAPVPNAKAEITAAGLTYTGLGGPNQITVALVDGRFHIADIAPITAGSGCLPSARGVFEVTCQAPLSTNGTIQRFFVNGGAGNDVILNTTSVGMTAGGGTGDDVVTGGSGVDVLSDFAGKDTLRGNGGNDALRTNHGPADGLTDTLEGGSGHDELEAGPNDDVLRGGSGNDTLRGGLGADELDGGSGSQDAVAYLDGSHDAFARLVISIDDKPDDGLRVLGTSSSQERDNVRLSVESVFAGHGNDVIFGSAAANLLHGNVGNDTISGGLGRDTIVGGPGNDTLASNQLFGVPVADGSIDTVDGSTGVDHCRVPFPTVEADLVACETVDND
jgi:Ca2+-binding RTX toxin-like protein